MQSPQASAVLLSPSTPPCADPSGSAAVCAPRILCSHLALMAGWEILAPCRRRGLGRQRRWPAIWVSWRSICLLVRAVFPTTAVGVAIAVEGANWGMLNVLGVSKWSPVATAIIALDLAIYSTRVSRRSCPLAAASHAPCRSRPRLDHGHPPPIEIVLSMGIKLAVISALGAPALTVLIFEALLNATSMFNHGNVRIPPGVDRSLRWLVVTPNMHRIHHSIVARETNSNSGFNLPWWDRLFGTYRADPAAGLEAMTVVSVGPRSRGATVDRVTRLPSRDDKNSKQNDNRMSTPKTPTILAGKDYARLRHLRPTTCCARHADRRDWARRTCLRCACSILMETWCAGWRRAKRAHRDADWACYHTDLYRLKEHDLRAWRRWVRAVGAPFAVLVTEELFASGCELLISMTSAGRLVELRPPPYLLLIDRALRDEGTSYHYLPPARSSTANSSWSRRRWQLWETPASLSSGATWTTITPGTRTLSHR